MSRSVIHEYVWLIEDCLSPQAPGAYNVPQFDVASPCAVLADCAILHGTESQLARNDVVFTGQVEVRGAAFCCLVKMNRCLTATFTLEPDIVLLTDRLVENHWHSFDV